MKRLTTVFYSWWSDWNVYSAGPIKSVGDSDTGAMAEQSKWNTIYCSDVGFMCDASLSHDMVSQDGEKVEERRTNGVVNYYFTCKLSIRMALDSETYILINK